MSQVAQQAATFNLGDFKVLSWIIGSVFSAAVGGVSVAVWFNKQFRTLEDRHRDELDQVRKDAEASRKGIYGKMAQNREDCQNTKNRVALIEQSHTHHSQRMDKMDDSLKMMQRDITDTKQQVNNLGVKVAEGNMAILQELRSKDK